MILIDYKRKVMLYFGLIYRQALKSLQLLALSGVCMTACEEWGYSCLYYKYEYGKDIENQTLGTIMISPPRLFMQ